MLGPVAARIEDYLLAEQVQHRQALDKAMNGRRYLALLRESQRWVDRPAVHRPRRGGNPTALRSAVRPRRTEGQQTPGRGSGPAETTRNCTRPARPANAPGTPPNWPHPVLGKKARKRIKRYEDLQDILGDHQDGVVAAELLRRIAAGTVPVPDENGFTYGLLYEQEQRRAEHSRQLARAWTP